MPKEYISSEPQERGSIAVSWGKDHGVVQVSVAGPVGWRDELLSKQAQSDESQDELGGLLGSLTTGLTDLVGSIVGINPAVDKDNDLDWYFTPNRAEINRLIAALRKARDQAFGKDE